MDAWPDLTTAVGSLLRREVPTGFGTAGPCSLARTGGQRDASPESAVDGYWTSGTACTDRGWATCSAGDLLCDPAPPSGESPAWH